jgi:hypothetical protein
MKLSNGRPASRGPCAWINFRPKIGFIEQAADSSASTTHPLQVVINGTIIAVANSVTITGGNASHSDMLMLQSGSLTTTGRITLNNNNAILNSAGTITAKAGIVGTGVLAAGTSRTGGILDVFESIASGVAFQTNSAAPTALKIEGTAISSAAIAISSANQTLEIGPTGNFDDQPGREHTNGKIPARRWRADNDGCLGRTCTTSFSERGR